MLDELAVMGKSRTERDCSSDEEKRKFDSVIEDELATWIKPDDVAVIYAEPTPEGTVYHHLRIDEDGEFTVVQDYGKIAKRYLTSWFFIDFIAVIPIDLLFGGSNINGIVRITRIGRMYRLIRLTRMLRVLKVIKEQTRLMDKMKDTLKIGIGFQRLLFFMLYFIIFTHVLSCFWMLVATYNSDKSKTWLGGDEDFIGKN